MLTKEEIQNLLRIMNRATFTGLAEATVAVQLQQKLAAMAEPKQLSTDADA